MVKYVTDEVERLKVLFQEREDQLGAERDKAVQSSQALSKQNQDTERCLKESRVTVETLAAEVQVAFF